MKAWEGFEIGKSAGCKPTLTIRNNGLTDCLIYTRMENTDHNSRKIMGLEWMDLRSLTEYASVSERTLREWIRRPQDPLPAVQVDRKIFVRRSQFDRWLESHPLQTDSVDIDRIVDEVVGSLTETQ